MADITMCTGGICPKKEECYRYKAEVNQYRQAYFVHVPYIPGMGCEMFTKDDRKSPYCKQYEEQSREAGMSDEH